MVGLQTLDLAIGVRVPASQPKKMSDMLQPLDALSAVARNHKLASNSKTHTTTTSALLTWAN
jgi:hypothetical protein